MAIVALNLLNFIHDDTPYPVECRRGGLVDRFQKARISRSNGPTLLPSHFIELCKQMEFSRTIAKNIARLLSIILLASVLQSCGSFVPLDPTSVSTTSQPGTTTPPTTTPPTTTPPTTTPPTTTPPTTTPPTTTPPTTTPPTTTPPTTTPHIVTAPRVAGRELQSLTLTVPNGFSATATSLPRGAFFDSATHRLLWLPQKGQSGQYQVELNDMQNNRIHIPIQLSPISEDILSLGPTDGVNDGDVGYVFVHGAGSVDRCVNHQDLANYWGEAPNLMKRSKGLSTVACYDGRQRIEYVAQQVAQQILDANCGTFHKCVVITHSMGGNVLEYILTHDRGPEGSDPEPALFSHPALYRSAKEKILEVISIASSAGGSRVADIVNDPGDNQAFQAVVGQISDWFGSDDDATRGLTTQRSSDLLAPYGWDPGIPFFMVPGYSVKTVREQDGDTIGLFNDLIGNISLNVYQGNQDLASLDSIVQDNSRFDGLVDFRSSCGVASDNAHDGPGYGASLAAQLNYCYSAPKKHNHYVWFLSNLNHFLISAPWNGCHNSKNPCTTRDADLAHETFSENPSYIYLSAVEVIRAKLDQNRSRYPALKSNIDNK